MRNINIIDISVQPRVGGWLGCMRGSSCVSEKLTLCCNHASQTTVLKCSFRGPRQGNVELSTTALTCVSVNGFFVHQVRAKRSVCVRECKCDSGE